MSRLKSTCSNFISLMSNLGIWIFKANMAMHNPIRYSPDLFIYCLFQKLEAIFGCKLIYTCKKVDVVESKLGKFVMINVEGRKRYQSYH